MPFSKKKKIEHAIYQLINKKCAKFDFEFGLLSGFKNKK